MYELKRKEGRARRGAFSTVHGTIQTPAFMNVATCGAIRGAVSALDLKELKCQGQLIIFICVQEIRWSRSLEESGSLPDGRALF